MALERASPESLIGQVNHSFTLDPQTLPEPLWDAGAPVPAEAISAEPLGQGVRGRNFKL